MSNKCLLRISRKHFDTITSHLFPGDWEEHGAVLLAGVSQRDGDVTLHVREVHLAAEGTDYVEGQIGYRALAPKFIHRSRVLVMNGLPISLFTIMGVTTR